MALEARSSQGQLGASVASSQYLLLPMTKKKKKKKLGNSEFACEKAFLCPVS